MRPQWDRLRRHDRHAPPRCRHRERARGFPVRTHGVSLWCSRVVVCWSSLVCAAKGSVARLVTSLSVEADSRRSKASESRPPNSTARAQPRVHKRRRAAPMVVPELVGTDPRARRAGPSAFTSWRLARKDGPDYRGTLARQIVCAGMTNNGRGVPILSPEDLLPDSNDHSCTHRRDPHVCDLSRGRVVLQPLCGCRISGRMQEATVACTRAIGGRDLRPPPRSGSGRADRHRARPGCPWSSAWCRRRVGPSVGPFDCSTQAGQDPRPFGQDRLEGQRQ